MYEEESLKVPGTLGMFFKFVKLICPKCHKDEKVIKRLRVDIQKEFEKNHTRTEFIEIIGKSYL